MAAATSKAGWKRAREGAVEKTRTKISSKDEK